MAELDQAACAAPAPVTVLRRRPEAYTVKLAGITLEVEPFGQFEKDFAEEAAKRYAREVVSSLETARELNLTKGVTAKLMDNTEGLDLAAGFGLFLYAVALAEIVVSKIVAGLVEADGETPATPSRRTFALLFQAPVAGDPAGRTYCELFIERTVGLQLLETGEGKSSAVVPSDISGPAAQSAGDA